ncbi:MAG: Fic family protein [Candidatus Moranbacteria bacterium]|jgi:Fic family protein|nr:Fic family protein [Candidatus Moranbacteria bacterium]
MTKDNKKLNQRQEKILSFIEEKGSVSIGQIVEYVGKVTRMTILRDLDKMLKLDFVEREGVAGRAVTYRISSEYSILKKIDVEKYFAVDSSERKINPIFNENIFDFLNDEIITEEEISDLEKINEKYLHSKDKLEKESPAILRREWERLIVEFSWKSSQIEGDTYTLLETEALIKEHRLAEGKDKAEAQMILNHKKALDFILENPDFFFQLETEKIKKIHAILVEGMDVKEDFRSHGVGIGGTLYRPLANKKELSRMTDKLSETVRNIKSPFAKALVALLMISYLQPFEDGNKRTARIVANGILHSHQKAMLSYRNIDVLEYKKAILLFYEQNNISYFKELFLKQFEFAVENYFG